MSESLPSKTGVPRRPEWEPDKEHIRFFGRTDKPEGVLIHHDQAAIAWWGYEEARADYWQAQSATLTARVAELEKALREIAWDVGAGNSPFDAVANSMDRMRMIARNVLGSSVYGPADETTGEQK